MQSNITFAITTLTLISHIVFVVTILLIVLDKKFRKFIYNFVDKNILSLLFIASMGAFVGSLAYSNILGFPPCELCWIQRIFIYPQALLVFIAIIKKDKGIVDYLLPLSILGAVVAFYHSLVHWGIGLGTLGCTSVGGECARVYVLEYGYITIPFMAFTSFVYLIAISAIYYLARNERNG